jgi:hypothetical protein
MLPEKIVFDSKSLSVSVVDLINYHNVYQYGTVLNFNTNNSEYFIFLFFFYFRTVSLNQPVLNSSVCGIGYRMKK